MVSAHESELRTLEPLAEMYVGTNRVEMFTPVIAGSIFCGVTWGILGLQYVKLVARGVKSKTAWSTAFASYLVLASTAYLGLLTAFMSYFFARNFGYYATAFDLTYTSWLFVLATILIHVPCQAFYARNAYKLTGESKILGLLLFVMIAGIVGVGATLKAILADIVIHLSWLEGFLIKFWIALSTATDIALTVILAIAHIRSKNKSELTFLRKAKILIVDAQLSATLVSIGLLVILMIKPTSSYTHLWLGLPLVYPINVLSTIGGKRAIREDLEAEVSGADRRASTTSTGSTGEKNHIPPAEKRPSFLLSPFPTINIRRASETISQYTIIPAISGVRRASQYLGVLPPVQRSQPKKKKTFPFRQKSSSGRNSPVELHPSSLHYPLSNGAAPMGESELVPRGKALERAHSLAQLDTEPALAISLGQPTASPFSPTSDSSVLPGHLSDPFANTPPRSSQSPSPRPTLSEAIEAHEIFEMPSTPDMMSPKSGHSPMILESPGFETPQEQVNPEWK